jgi:hypothetical protein
LKSFDVVSKFSFSQGLTEPNSSETNLISSDKVENKRTCISIIPDDKEKRSNKQDNKIAKITNTVGNHEK